MLCLLNTFWINYCCRKKNRFPCETCVNFWITCETCVVRSEPHAKHMWLDVGHMRNTCDWMWTTCGPHVVTCGPHVIHMCCFRKGILRGTTSRRETLTRSYFGCTFLSSRSSTLLCRVLRSFSSTSLLHFGFLTSHFPVLFLLRLPRRSYNARRSPPCC